MDPVGYQQTTLIAPLCTKGTWDQFQVKGARLEISSTLITDFSRPFICRSWFTLHLFRCALWAKCYPNWGDSIVKSLTWLILIDPRAGTECLPMSKYSSIRVFKFSCASVDWLAFWILLTGFGWFETRFSISILAMWTGKLRVRKPGLVKRPVETDCQMTQTSQLPSACVCACMCVCMCVLLHAHVSVCTHSLTRKLIWRPSR